jgi:hypothetical protein
MLTSIEVAFSRLILVALLVNQIVMVAAAAAELTSSRERRALSGNMRASQLTAKKAAAIPRLAQVDRVANAVDGAESSYGHDIGMWRPNPSGPQGPMQVSEAAASDVGGGDRFDLAQNRVLGRAYLARLYRRYNNWPDAIAAYNWGLGKVDSWIRAGRPSEKLQAAVTAYTIRVLRDSRVCNDIETTQLRPSPILGGNPEFRAVADRSAQARFAGSGDSVKMTGNGPYFCGTAPGGRSELSRAGLYVVRPPQSPFERMVASARASWNAGIHNRSAGEGPPPEACNYSFLTNGHSPCSIGRNASSSGIERTRL